MPRAHSDLLGFRTSRRIDKTGDCRTAEAAARKNPANVTAAANQMITPDGDGRPDASPSEGPDSHPPESVVFSKFRFSGGRPEGQSFGIWS
jgi:hypothetical protein